MIEQNILKEQLRTVNQSLFYLMLIILSVLLSFRSVLIQREQLEGTLAGNPPKAAADVFPIKLTASALTAGALGFFFVLALQNCRDAAQGNDPAAQKSAGMNVWTSFFALTAALIHLYDLNFMEETQRSLVIENVQPEHTWAE